MRYVIFLLDVPLAALLPALWLHTLDNEPDEVQDFALVLYENAQTFERLVVTIMEDINERTAITA